MAKDRLALQAKLREIAPKAWYKRPPDNKMCYPCIIYRPSNPAVFRAENMGYALVPCYNVIYITTEPDDNINKTMLESFEHCGVDREYEADGLYHYSFTVYW